MSGLLLARALHVLGVVIWIGGVYMVTTIILPIVRRGELGADWLAAFHAVERRFVWHARAGVLLVGLSGFYMIEKLNLWIWFTLPGYWWMHAMALLWTLFAIMLFAIEPFILHRRLADWVARDPERAFARLHRMHVLLLVLSVITILAATAGAHGWQIM